MRKIYVYNFDLTDEQVNELNTYHNIFIKKLNLKKYPSWIEKEVKDRNRCICSAIKILAIKELLNEIPNNILWIDAGSQIGQKLDIIQEYINKKGYFFTCFANDTHMKEYTHIDMLNYFKVPEYKDYLGHTSGGNIGFKGGNKSWVYKNIILPSFNCLLDKNCIEPQGANINNHRYDSSLISLLIEKNNIRCGDKTINFDNYCTENIKCCAGGPPLSKKCGTSENDIKKYVINNNRGSGILFPITKKI